MKTIAYTNNFFGTGQTRQQALINLLSELEKNNSQAQMIRFKSLKAKDDLFKIMESGMHDSSINL